MQSNVCYSVLYLLRIPLRVSFLSYIIFQSSLSSFPSPFSLVSLFPFLHWPIYPYSPVVSLICSPVVFLLFGPLVIHATRPLCCFLFLFLALLFTPLLLLLFSRPLVWLTDLSLADTDFSPTRSMTRCVMFIIAFI